jgi:hypothetical protein
MVTDLWQAAGHGKQGRTKTRSQEAAQEETAEASRVSSSGAHGEQAGHHPEALTSSFAGLGDRGLKPDVSRVSCRFRTYQGLT